MGKSIAWFAELGRGDALVAGGKGANLGELTHGGFPVPPGFVVTAESYLQALEAGGVRDQIRDAVAGAEQREAGELGATASRLRDLVEKAGMPKELGRVVLDAYHELGSPARVAVRSSATAEDAGDTSFAGMNRTFTNVTEQDLLDRIVDCWASLFGERVFAYRAALGVRDEPAIAVVVQVMLDADRSGVMFSADPATGDPSRVIIEGAFGLGEVVVGGAVEPDTYVVDKDGPRLVSVRVGQQAIAVRRGPDGADLQVELSAAEGARRVLSDDDTLTLARLAARVEEHYGSPQDMEWAFQGDELYLVQSRPITALPRSGAPSAGGSTTPAPDPVVSGMGASPGIAAGRVRRLASVDDTDQFESGEVLVARMTTPDWVPAMRRAAALVTDGGGVTCHAAIASRELGVPCVVGDPSRDGAVPRRRGRHGRRRRRRGVPGRPERRVGAGTGAAADRADELGRSPGDASVCQPGYRRTRRRGRGAARRRSRIAAGRAHAHRGAAGRASPSRAGPRGRGRVPRPHGPIAASRHPGVRAPPSRLPHHRLSKQRVPRAERR